MGEPPASPIPQLYDGKLCYCCCSCPPASTWVVERAINQFSIVEDLMALELVLAGSLDLEGQLAWKPTPVDFVAGIGPRVEFHKLHYVSFRLDDRPPRFIIVTPDHLFLMAGGLLKPAQRLTAGDQLRHPHAGTATVEFSIPVRYVGAMHHLLFPGFDGSSLDGHLLSVNGTVSADYAVQLAFSVGTLNPAWIEVAVPEEPSAPGGALAAFLDDPERWPPGVTPQGID